MPMTTVISTLITMGSGVIYRELKWEDIKFAFAETVRVSGRIFIVIGAAKLYTVMLTRRRSSARCRLQWPR